jgi:metal-sulfur cluster biosynthetic enzyme
MDEVLPHHDQKTSEVWTRLALVTDPELDESVTELGFIERVTVQDDGGVDIVFRLPTYWCSANFAFLMADDMRRAVSSLPWVSEARPQLQDHMVAEEINRGVSEGKSFGDALKDFAPGGSLDNLREKFRRKAFERRQEAVIAELRKGGYDDAAICQMTLSAYDQVDFGSEEAARQKPRYRQLLVERGLGSLPDDRAFVTYEGRPIERHELRPYLQLLRGVRINMEFNSALCRGLLAERYRTPAAERAGEVSVDAAACEGCGSGCPVRSVGVPATTQKQPAALA